jgi:rhomboid-like protein
LPKDYNPEVGLPFRETPLTQDEATNIFGKGIEANGANGANRILRLLHGQRVSGTLEDPNALRYLMPFEEQLMNKGLEWLRNNVPVDEINNAGLRAEQEMREMEAEILEDSERIGLYKPNSGPQTANPYGKSGLESIREAKEKAWEEKEKKRKSQADEIRQNTGTLATTGGSSVVLRRPGENPRLKYFLERSKVLPETPPEMSKFQRLWPGGLVVLGTLVGGYVFTQVYTPPKTSARLFLDMPPSAATIIGIVMINAAVLLAWRIPPLFRTLNKNFIMVPGYLFPTSIIGSVFSHQTVSHFAVNMAMLYFAGTRLHEEIGRGNFLAVYLICGALGCYTSMISFVLRNNFVSSTLGASGAICGIVACYLSMNGKEKVRAFGIFPPDDWPALSSFGLLVILIGIDAVAICKRRESNKTIDHWAHLGGYAGGIGCAEWMKYRYRARRNREIEKRKDMGIVDRIKGGRV